VNPDVGDQQQEPTEVIQPSDNASLDAVGISLLKQGEDVKMPHWRGSLSNVICTF